MKKVEIDYTMRGYILSDDIEDVEYVDVSEAPQAYETNTKKPSYDINARAEEIAVAAQKKSKELNKRREPSFDLLIMFFFSYGAEWADQNPKSKFPDAGARSEALFKEMEEHQKEVDSMSGEKHPRIHTVSMCIAILGFHWADKNPPKYY